MRSKLLLLCAPRSGGGGVEGLGGLGERKKGSPLPLIPIPQGSTVYPKIILKNSYTNHLKYQFYLLFSILFMRKSRGTNLNYTKNKYIQKNQILKKIFFLFFKNKRDCYLVTCLFTFFYNFTFKTYIINYFRLLTASLTASAIPSSNADGITYSGFSSLSSTNAAKALAAAIFI